MTPYSRLGVVLALVAPLILAGLGFSATPAAAWDFKGVPQGGVAQPHPGAAPFVAPPGKVIVPPNSTVVVQPPSRIILPSQGTVIVVAPRPYWLPTSAYVPSYTYVTPSYEDRWVPGYWAQQWVPQYYAYDVWVGGYYDSDGFWVDGYYERRAVDNGYYQQVWVPGSWIR